MKFLFLPLFLENCHENKVFKAYSQNTFVSIVLIQFYFSFLPKQGDAS